MSDDRSSAQIARDDSDAVPAPSRGTRSNAPRLSRAMQERRAQQRPGIGGEHKGRLHVDPALLDPTREYTWIREETLGERDKGNIQDALDNGGYDPVSAKDHPELQGKTLPGWENTDQLVRRGGLVLMSRPKVYGIEARQALAQENADAIASVSRTLDESRNAADPAYIQKPKDERIAVTVDRGDTGANKRERFVDA